MGLRCFLAICSLSLLEAFWFNSDSEDALLTYDTTCDPVSGTCFWAFDTEVSHVDAWYECHRQGLHLAMPRTEEELNFLASNITGDEEHEGFWIGLTDYYVEGEWMWMDGVMASNIPWKPMEPKDSYGYEEDCVEIDHSGWNNARCESLKPYLCQYHRPECSSSSAYQHGGYCYHVITGDYPFNPSYCSGIGGTLAMPKNAAINSYIYQINYEEKDMWIGLLPNVDHYVWIDKTVLTTEQARFISLPPNPLNTDGIFMTSGGYWDGVPLLAHTASYVCQVQLPGCGTYHVSNGTTLSNGTVGTNHTYECVDGYLPLSPYTVCQTTGVWEPTPRCVVVVVTADCGAYLVQDGSKITGNTSEGANHTYTCNEGFTSNSTNTVCQSSGLWEPVPGCFNGSTTNDTDESLVCYCDNSTTPNTNLTAEEQAELYVQQLTVEKETLSSRRRQLTSAEDDRASAKSIGISGVMALTVLGLLICVPDLVNLFSFITVMYKDCNA